MEKKLFIRFGLIICSAFLIFNDVVSRVSGSPNGDNKQRWTLAHPIIFGSEKIGKCIFLNLSKAYQAYSDSCKVYHSSLIITIDSLVKLKQRGLIEYSEERKTCFIGAFLIGPHEIESNIFVYSIDSNKLISYSKNYLPLPNSDTSSDLYSPILEQIKSTNKFNTVNYEAESQFEALLAETESKIIEEENKLKLNEIKFQDYDRDKIYERDPLKFAINRVDYFLETLEREFPFSKYPNRISQALIDDKIYLELNDLQNKFPHTYWLLIATNALNEFLHLKYQKSSQESLQLRSDSLEHSLSKLDSVFDNTLISEEENKIWQSLDKSLSIELFDLVKIKKKAVDACSDLIFQRQQSNLNSDINLRIQHSLRLLRERCGSSTSKDVTSQSISKFNNWISAMLMLDTLTQFRIEHLKLANDNHIDLKLLRPNIIRIETISKDKIKKYIASNIDKYMKNSENELYIEKHVTCSDNVSFPFFRTI